VPAGPDWLHEIQNDGYRTLVIREQDRVRLMNRGGQDWAKHFPLIVAAALKLRRKHFVLDGEAVVLDEDSVSDFDALASRKHDKRAQFYAFDMLARDGEDLRGLPLSLRKSNLARLLSRPVDGIFIAEYEQGDIGHDLFRVTATWASKASSRNVSIAPMAPASAPTGPKSRIPRIRPTTGSGIGWLFGPEHLALDRQHDLLEPRDVLRLLRTSPGARTQD
jgi:hypothetical protein